MDRLPHPLSLPFSPDILWRYPLSSLSSSTSSQPPSSPLLDKQQLPGALGPDPRTWGREDVLTFLRWCEREFDLPGLDLDKFQMNGNTITTAIYRSLNTRLSRLTVAQCHLAAII